MMGMHTGLDDFNCGPEGSQTFRSYVITNFFKSCMKIIFYTCVQRTKLSSNRSFFNFLRVFQAERKFLAISIGVRTSYSGDY